MESIKEGNRVTILSSDNTRSKIGLDDEGEMKTMVGGFFTVTQAYDNKVYIKSVKYDYEYVWDIRDIRLIEDKEPEPNIFKFNEKLLDI